MGIKNNRSADAERFSYAQCFAFSGLKIHNEI